MDSNNPFLSNPNGKRGGEFFNHSPHGACSSKTWAMPYSFKVLILSSVGCVSMRSSPFPLRENTATRGGFHAHAGRAAEMLPGREDGPSLFSEWSAGSCRRSPESTTPCRTRAPNVRGRTSWPTAPPRRARGWQCAGPGKKFPKKNARSIRP